MAVCLWIIIMKTCACNWDMSLFDLLLNILVTSSHLAWGGSFLLRRISWTLLPLLCLFWNVRKYVYKKIYQMFRNMLSSSSAILWIVYMMVKISFRTNYCRFIKQGGMFLCATNHNGSQKSSHPVVVHYWGLFCCFPTKIWCHYLEDENVLVHQWHVPLN